MSLSDTLSADMKTAMKSGEKARLSALRLLVSAVRYEGIDTGEMTDAKVIEVLQREAKKRRESIEAYHQAGRAEQEQEEREELMIINSYLPQMMDEGEVRKRAKKILQASKVDNVGQAIGLVMKELKGQADGGVVAKIVKDIFQTNDNH